VLLPRRKHFVVDKKLQLYFMWSALLYVATPLFVITISLFLPLVVQLNTTEMTSREAQHSARLLLYLHDRFWMPLALSLVAAGLHSVYATHRVAGPLYRFRMTFASIEKGLLPKKVRLRRRDLLRPEMEALNAMLRSLRNTAEQTQKDAADLDRLICRYREVRAEPGPEPEQILAEMTTVVKHLRSTCSSLAPEE
jgi:hypothetical protein